MTCGRLGVVISVVAIAGGCASSGAGGTTGGAGSSASTTVGASSAGSGPGSSSSTGGAASTAGGRATSGSTGSGATGGSSSASGTGGLTTSGGSTGSSDSTGGGVCSGNSDGLACVAADGAAGTCDGGTCISSLCGTHSDGNVCHRPGGDLSFCWNGYCLPLTCPSGESGGACAAGGRTFGVLGTCCDGTCSALAQDPRNCGGCGYVCQGYCYGGACWESGCPGGAPSLLDAGGCLEAQNLPANFCEGDGGWIGYVVYGFSSATCVDLLDDPANCGAPGATCPYSQSCANGACSGDVPPCGTGAQQGLFCALDGGGMGACCPGGGCDDIASDPSNCGACGNGCPGGFGCLDGRCLVPSCASSNTESGVTPCALDGGSPGLCCGTACVDTGADPANCGACGRVCGGGESCAGGACGFDGCAAHAGDPCHLDGGAQGECCGGCVSTSSDPSNCGGCGVACPAGAACASGQCT